MATKTKTPKAANYSPEQVACLKDNYVKGADNKTQLSRIAAMPVMAGKTVNSIRAKASSMGIFQKNEGTATTSTRTKKTDIIVNIVNAGVPLTETEQEGLAKSTTNALNKVLERLTVLTTPVEVEGEEVEGEEAETDS